MAQMILHSRKYGEFKVLLDNEDYEKLKDYKWYVNMCHDKYPRVVANINKAGKKRALALMIMKPPEGMIVDHINRNPLDNRRANLRLITPRQNSLNVGRNYTMTPHLGVYRCGRKGKGYFTAVRHRGLTYRIGSFDTPEEAREAYRKLLQFVIGKEAALLDELQAA